MTNDPVNTVMAILTIPLVIFAVFVAWRVITKHGPQIPKIWKESRK